MRTAYGFAVMMKFLLFPWWLLRVFGGAKSFSGNPLLGSRSLNRRGLHVLRVRVAAAMAARRRRALARRLSAPDRAAFDRDGYLERRDFLPPAVFEHLCEAALAYRGPAREMVQGDTVTRRFALDGAALAAIPAARAVLTDPFWRGAIRYADSHDAEPLVYLQAILSNVHDDAPDPQTALHADTFHATAKAWLFLTDVAADEGPFCYVPGSHRDTPARLAWERARSLRAADLDTLSARGSLRVAPDELAGLGLPPPRAFAVPANTLIVADTHGFHARGAAVRRSTRIELFAYARHTPFLPWSAFDLARLPGVAQRRIGWMWRLRDRLERWTGQPWHDVGLKRPGDPPGKTTGS